MYSCIFMTLGVLPTMADIVEVQPFGMKMCENLCQRYPVGTKCVFQERLLYCRIHPNPDTCGHVTFEKEKGPNIMRRAFICLKDMDLQAAKKTPKRLLLVKKDNRHPKFSILDLATESASELKVCKAAVGKIAAITFIKTKNLIVIGLVPKNIVLTCSLSDPRRQQKQNFGATGFSQDESMNLLFFVCLHTKSRKAIAKKKFEAIGMKVLFVVGGHIHVCIAVDTRKALIFVSLDGIIKALDYDGKYRFDVMNGVRLSLVVVDPESATIFYAHGGHIFKRHLTGPGGSKQKRIRYFRGMNIFHMTVDEEYLYVTLRQTSNLITAISIRNHQKVISINTGYQSKHSLYICKLY